MKRAAIYCSVGGVGKAHQQSLDLQEASCRAYCEAQEYQIVVIKRELASGAKLSRPQLQEIEAFARTGEIEVVVIQAANQLSLTPDGVAFWEGQLGRWGATVEFVQGRHQADGD
jgi:DNA invertase Pin-like site-specific DNA recombinase